MLAPRDLPLPRLRADGPGGRGDASALLQAVPDARGATIPLLPIARDPWDGSPDGPLSSRLDEAQEALLGCGRLVGTSCDRQGIGGPGLVGAARFVTDGLTVAPGSRPWIPGQAAPGSAFANELIAVSFNLLTILVGFSSGNGGTPGSDPSAFDPDAPCALYDPDDPSTAAYAD